MELGPGSVLIAVAYLTDSMHSHSCKAGAALTRVGWLSRSELSVPNAEVLRLALLVCEVLAPTLAQYQSLGFERKWIRAGTLVFAESEMCDAVYVIASGRVHVVSGKMKNAAGSKRSKKAVATDAGASSPPQKKRPASSSSSAPPHPSGLDLSVFTEAHRYSHTQHTAGARIIAKSSAAAASGRVKFELGRGELVGELTLFGDVTRDDESAARSGDASSHSPLRHTATALRLLTPHATHSSSTMSDADIDASSSNDETQPTTSSRKAKSKARQRNAGAVTSDAASSSSATATPVSASTPQTAASLMHANHGRSASSAHICSNTASCPLIAAFEAAVPEDRHKLPLSEELFACSACKSVLYCSRDCQALHWIDGGHKAECPKLAKKWAETPEPGAATAAPIAAASASSSHGAAAAAPAHVRRQYRLNLDIAFGPRSLIILFLLLYLIYRFTRGRSNDPSAAHAEL